MTLPRRAVLGATFAGAGLLTWPRAQAKLQMACPPGGPSIEPLGEGLWWVPADVGDAQDSNRGQVSNLLLARDADRVWLIGSGPTPAFGRRLACQIRVRLGGPVTDLISSWPRPEAVLGASGLAPVRHWGHAEVADAMQLRCASCLERLRARLGAAAVDLGDNPVVLPSQHLRGASGSLGPWDWMLLSRGESYPVTVWRHRVGGLVFAPGLFWGNGVVDGRDADLQSLLASLEVLSTWNALRWLGEQGAVCGPEALQAQVAYWRWLLDAARVGVERGDDEGTLPTPPDALSALARQDQHALNWQRAWRQAESRWFQRSLR